MMGDTPILEAWAALTWLASEFPNHRFGNLVLSQGYAIRRCWPRWPPLSST